MTIDPTLLSDKLRGVPEASLAALRGRRVVIPAPSYQFLTKEGAINHARRELALGNLEALGIIPTLMGGVMAQDGRYAGTDEVRAADLQTALVRDRSTADLMMPIRGGYGMTRLLPLLDWEAIGRSSLPIVGFSDFTALNLALLSQTGRPSWHGPMLGSFDDPEPFMVERFAVVFGAELPPLEWTADSALYGSVGDVPQRFSGMLWGGNLCLIESLVGTPWMPSMETIDGGILFLEDVGEYAYRVERMLLTLLDAGILGRQKAILLGDFANADDSIRFPGDQSLADTLAYIRRRLPASIPMVTGLPFGHIARKATLPVGLDAELSLESGRVQLSWGTTP